VIEVVLALVLLLVVEVHVVFVVGEGVENYYVFVAVELLCVDALEL
jgi:hypothetical protein